VRLLSRTLHHAGADRVHIVQANLEAGVPFAEGSFDCVVVDAPCSGLGTIRRDPDIRWRRLPEDLPGFGNRQLRLLEQTSQTVRRGGRLVYATCSSEPEENEDVIARFLLEQPTFAITDLRTASGGAVPAVVLDERGFLRTLPFAHDLEAFFAAMLQRV
jgi:16S rRNA (cytosine967-C5)-methyltransferase